MNIEIISGSPRTQSISYRVAVHLKKTLKEKTQHNIGLIDVRENDLGLLQNVFTSVDNTPEKHKLLSERIFSADAFILVSPEYNGSYSPALQNLLDHYPKQAHKAFGIVTSSPGIMGGMRAAQRLVSLVPGLFGITSPYMLLVPSVEKKFDEQGNLIDPAFENSINNFVAEFIWLAEALQAKKQV